MNLLDNTPNQTSKFSTKTWVEINNESRGTYNTNSQIKVISTMLKSTLCDYNDLYTPAKGIITITGTGDYAATRQADKRDEGVIFKKCTRFTDCISEINNTHVDLDVVMWIYNLIEYSNNYSKSSENL